MAPNHSRRRFLQLSAGTYPFLAGPNLNVDAVEQQTISVSGDVFDLTGRRVPNIGIQISDAEDEQVVASTESNADGHFEVEVDPPETAILRAYELGPQTEWFTGDVYTSGEELRNLERITLDRQILAGPLPILTEADEGAGMVTLWRRIDRSDHKIQIFNLEVTEVAYFPDKTLRGFIPADDPSLQGGMFSLVVPEDVTVAYGPELAETTFGAGFSGLYRSEDRARTKQWLQSPYFPRYESLPRNYTQFSKSDIKQEKIEDEFWGQLLSIAAGAVPILGEMATVVETIAWVNGFQDEPPPDVTAGDQVSETPNPNTHDTNSEMWTGDSSSVLFQVPVKFDTSEKDELIATAVWRTDKLHAKYTKELTVGATEPELRIGETPSGNDDSSDVTGRILQHDGSPAADRTLVLVDENGEIMEMLTTDGEGGFSYEKPNATHDIQYYQLTDADTSDADFDPEGTPYPRDGSPDLFAVSRLSPMESGDLGTIELPKAYPLDVRVVDGDGSPVEEARVIIGHENEANGGDAGLSGLTNESGYYDVWPDSDTTGLEVSGKVPVDVKPPLDSDAFENSSKQRELSVTDPTEITVTLERQSDGGSDDVNGRIIQHDGTPAANHTLVVYRVADKAIETWATTDEEGRFSYSVESNSDYDIQYYQLYDTNTENNRFDPEGTPGPRDSFPDVFALARHQGPASLGTLELPRGYPLEIRVVDRDGNPIENARVTVEHYSDDDESDAGLGPYLTNRNGYFVWGGKTGIELRGDVTLVVQPPKNSNNYEIDQKERDLRVTEPTTIEVTLDQIDP